MVCEKCGKEYEDSLKACPFCAEEEDKEIPMETAEKLEEEVEASKEDLEAALKAAKEAGEAKQADLAKQEEKEEDEIPKSKLPMVIAIVVIVGMLVIAGVVAALYFGGNQTAGKEAFAKVVEQYMKGYEEKDVNKILKTYPQFMQDALLKDSTADKIWENIESSFSESLGKDWKASYKMGEIAKISSSDISALKSDLESTYSVTLDFTSGYWVAADMTLSGNGESNTMPLLFAVVKVDDKWSIVYQTYNSTGQGSDAATTQTTSEAAGK